MMSLSRRIFLFLPMPALLALLAGLVANAVLFLLVVRLENRQEESQFQQLAVQRFTAVEIGVSNAMEAILSVNRWFATAGKVTPEQFQAFIEPIRRVHSYFIAFGYQVIVPGGERAAYVKRMRKRHPDFMLKDRTPEGAVYPAGNWHSYQVIEYLEPFAGNEILLGLNTRSMAAHVEASRRAQQSGQAASTRLFALLQFPDKPQGFLVFAPLYRAPPAGNPGQPARKSVTGYTVAAFRAPELFQRVLAAAKLLDHPGVSIRLYAGAPNPSEERVYHSKEEGRGDKACYAGWLYSAPDHELSHPFKIADASWRLVVSGRAQPCMKAHAGSMQLLLLGTLATLMATSYLTMLHRRALQLAHVNAMLCSSEERFRRLVYMSSDWYWEQDAEFRFTMMAGRMVQDHPELLDLVLGKTRWEIAAPEFPALEMTAHRTAVQELRPFQNFEYPVANGPNPAFWVSVNGEPLFDEAGGFVGYRGTSKDISGRKRAEQALRQLTAHREAIKEQERKRIAREIHDELGQTLLALRLDASMLHTRTLSCPRMHARVTLALEQIDSAMAAMRAIINDLRPPVLDLGIDAAIEWQVKRFRERTAIDCDLAWDSDAAMLDERIATAMFRIVQESLNNVQKHARARRVRITLGNVADGLTMVIADDGVGADAGACSKPNAFGLAGIGERVLALGGRFEFITAPGQGMTLCIYLPLPAECGAAARR
jgi:PAS domain S-box-containing protein